MPASPKRKSMQNVYAKWAPVYDLVFQKLTSAATKEAVSYAMACGTRILEVGVGTGLSLGYYSGYTNVYGVDLSENMLTRARQKVREQGLHHVKSLQVMDACHLGFADESFDAVAAQFVITLVPNPEQALAEFKRVLKPGGEIIFANHFGATGPIIGPLEDKLGPVFTKIGWSSGFKSDRLVRWAKANGMESLGVKAVSPAGFYKVLRLKKPKV
jgi:phosphatidylethanolamine/phosphatidyl-N-methylethanolamine N-methyltransferase